MINLKDIKQINIQYLNKDLINSNNKYYENIIISNKETYSQLLKRIGINEYTVLVMNEDNEPLPLDSIIENNKIKILKITFD